jgi:hypothetical protein
MLGKFLVHPSAPSVSTATANVSKLRYVLKVCTLRTPLVHMISGLYPKFDLNVVHHIQ